MEVAVTTWAIKDAQSSSQIVTTNIAVPTFCRPDALPVTQLTLKGESITFNGNAHPRLIWRSSILSRPLKAPGYLGGRVDKLLVSTLMPVP